jgi:deoxyribodipyrimidine photolyase
MLRHQFTTYDYETAELRKKNLGCIKLKERCAHVHQAYNMVQEVIENLIRREHIAACMTANRAFLASKLKEYSDEEERLRSMNIRIPNAQDAFEAKKKGRTGRTCRDLFPDMCSITTNT